MKFTVDWYILQNRCQVGVSKNGGEIGWLQWQVKGGEQNRPIPDAFNQEFHPADMVE